VESQDNKGIIKYIPNALTVGRLVLTVIFLAMILYAPSLEAEKTANFLLIAFILFIVTVLTDIVDGKVARMYDVTSKFGRIADPLADKFLVCGAFICFAFVRQPSLNNFNISPETMEILRWSAAFIIIARELIVTILRQMAEARGVNFGATVSGKIKMFLQSFCIGTVLIKWAYVSRIWGDCFAATAFSLMIFITVFSGIRSVQRPRRKKTAE
jgi:CDP-diacylglycerol--glycerol-3-phosphate 3-phosphatidyltransferase